MVVDVWNRAMCHLGMAERHSFTAGSDEMNKTEMADRLAARTGLSKGAAKDEVNGVFAIVGEAPAVGEEVPAAGVRNLRHQEPAGSYRTQPADRRGRCDIGVHIADVQGGEDVEG